MQPLFKKADLEKIAADPHHPYQRYAIDMLAKEGSGHEFHGNQYSGGGGGDNPHLDRGANETAARQVFTQGRDNQTSRDQTHYDKQLATHNGDHLATVRAWHANSSNPRQRTFTYPNDECWRYGGLAQVASAPLQHLAR